MKSLKAVSASFLICLSLSVVAHARLGEASDQLIKRFGKPIKSEPKERGVVQSTFKFSDGTLEVEVTFADDRSVEERYFSTVPLETTGEPPVAIVREIFNKNAPTQKWHDAPVSGVHEDSAFVTADGLFGAWISNNGSWHSENCTFVICVYEVAKHDLLTHTASTDEARDVQHRDDNPTPPAEEMPAKPESRVSESESSLEELLTPSSPRAQTSTAKGDALWESLLDLLERAEFSHAKDAAYQIGRTNEIIEPYQQTYADLVLEILRPDNTQSILASKNGNLQTYIAQQKRNIDELSDKIALEDRKRAPILKRISTNQTGGQIGALFSPIAGQIADSNIANAQKEMEEIDRNIGEYKSQIDVITKAISEAKNENEGAKRSVADSAEQNRDALKRKVVATIEQLQKGYYFRAVGALSNCYLREIGKDSDVAELAQNSLDLQKRQIQAIKIAKAAIKPARESLSQGKFWTAESEYNRAIALIDDKLKDDFQRQVVAAEIASTKRDIATKLEGAKVEMNDIMHVARSNAGEADEKMKVFLQEHSDLPEQKSTLTQIRDFKEAQIIDRLKSRVEAVEAVLQNDPSEAKAMAKRLETTLPPDEFSLIKAKINALEVRGLQRELDLIESKIGEAQSYLTRYSMTYANDIKEGKHPKISFTSGVENLVRARSIQTGIVKQLEALVPEEMPNIQRARLSGLLETEREALRMMNETIVEQDKARLWTVIVVSVLFSALGFLIIKKLYFSSKPVLNG